MISSLLDVKKALESDVGAKQKAFANSKQQLMEVRKNLRRLTHQF
jgi:phage shock protein A